MDDFTEEGLYRSLAEYGVAQHMHETFVQYVLIGRLEDSTTTHRRVILH